MKAIRGSVSNEAGAAIAVAAAAVAAAAAAAGIEIMFDRLQRQDLSSLTTVGANHLSASLQLQLLGLRSSSSVLASDYLHVIDSTLFDAFVPLRHDVTRVLVSSFLSAFVAAASR